MDVHLTDLGWSQIGKFNIFELELGQFNTRELSVVCLCQLQFYRRVLDCYEMIQNKIRMRLNATKTSGTSVSFVPESPISVVEVPCLSHTTEKVQNVQNSTLSPIQQLIYLRKSAKCYGQISYCVNIVLSKMQND